MLFMALGLFCAMWHTALMAQTNGAVEDTITDEQLAGRYHLVGQMETASGLRLNADGSFDWYLTVGGLDMFANGRWLVDQKIVVLHFDAFKGNAPAGSKAAGKPFETLKFRKDGDDLISEDNFKGVYVRIKSDPRG